MTAIKQKAVTSKAHAASMTRYLNDERALERATQNINRSSQWSLQMERTREAFGHDTPSRAGAKNTVMYHQVVAFNPDECDTNGGKLSPKDCMEYTRQYLEMRYPHQEAVYVLHKEHCEADNTDRYAVHIGINRTNLETGNRLDEGLGRAAAISRANSMKDLDREHGLKQLEPNRQNSKTHGRQPSKPEREMKERGKKPEKETMRREISEVKNNVMKLPESERPKAFADELSEKNITMRKSKGNRDFQFEREGIRVNGSTLGDGFDKDSIISDLSNNREMEREMKQMESKSISLERMR